LITTPIRRRAKPSISPLTTSTACPNSGGATPPIAAALHSPTNRLTTIAAIGPGNPAQPGTALSNRSTDGNLRSIPSHSIVISSTQQLITRPLTRHTTS
jgi:hypothetical protein